VVQLPLSFVFSGPAKLRLNGVWLGIFIGAVLAASALSWLISRSNWAELSRVASARGKGMVAGTKSSLRGRTGDDARGAYLTVPKETSRSVDGDSDAEGWSGTDGDSDVQLRKNRDDDGLHLN